MHVFGPPNAQSPLSPCCPLRRTDCLAGLRAAGPLPDRVDLAMVYVSSAYEQVCACVCVRVCVRVCVFFCVYVNWAKPHGIAPALVFPPRRWNTIPPLPIRPSPSPPPGLSTAGGGAEAAGAGPEERVRVHGEV